MHHAPELLTEQKSACCVYQVLITSKLFTCKILLCIAWLFGLPQIVSGDLPTTRFILICLHEIMEMDLSFFLPELKYYRIGPGAKFRNRKNNCSATAIPVCSYSTASGSERLITQENAANRFFGDGGLPESCSRQISVAC